MSHDWTYRARLNRVVDGDTYIMLIDLGFRTYGFHAIRLAGVNAPELRTEEGDLAKVWATEWFWEHSHLVDAEEGWPFILLTEKLKTTFNRYIGTITCSQGHDLSTAVKEAVEAHSWVVGTPPSSPTTPPANSP